MMRYVTKSAAETRKLGEELARRLLPGDAVLLYGELGAGKSEFTRGIAKGLGVRETVTSPSFTILQVYESGRLPLYHFDWYRLGDPGELYELSMEEYLRGDGVAVVEWPQQAEEAVPPRHLRVTLTPAGEEAREIVLEPMGGFRELEPLA
jgi:tRNA threonylcarbamoyladenosine biosynthesis protein TsaE